MAVWIRRPSIQLLDDVADADRNQKSVWPNRLCIETPSSSSAETERLDSFLPSRMPNTPKGVTDDRKSTDSIDFTRTNHNALVSSKCGFLSSKMPDLFLFSAVPNFADPSL